MPISARANCFRRWGFALAVWALAANLAGCVERRMTIRSNPPGAQVYVDDYEIGTTPVSTGYIYYGTRKIRLVKDGYETLTVYQPMPHPWYDWPGIDFFSENIWPGKIRDERAFDYQMQPLISVPTDELRARAEQLRSASQATLPPEMQPIATPVLPPATLSPGAAPGLPPAYTNAPPIVNTGPPTVPLQSGTVSPGTVPAPVYNPIPSTSTPTLNAPGSYPPPGGYPGAYPAPNPYPAPSTAPVYPAPGAAPANTPSTGPLFNQPVVPPDWRPIGEASTPLER
jgi:hypothetical protein